MCHSLFVPGQKRQLSLIGEVTSIDEDRYRFIDQQKLDHHKLTTEGAEQRQPIGIGSQIRG